MSLWAGVVVLPEGGGNKSGGQENVSGTALPWQIAEHNE